MKTPNKTGIITQLIVMLLLMQGVAIAQIGPSRAQPVPSVPASKAVTGVKYTDVKVTGTILSTPPCKINNDVNLDFDFGDVVIQKIKSGNSYRTLPIDISCQLAPKPTINLTISGAGNNNVLETNITGLGIALLNNDNGQAVDIGKKINLSLNAGVTKLMLKAVLVNPNDTVFKPGDFKTTATLTTSYD